MSTALPLGSIHPAYRSADDFSRCGQGALASDEMGQAELLLPHAQVGIDLVQAADEVVAICQTASTSDPVQPFLVIRFSVSARRRSVMMNVPST